MSDLKTNLQEILQDKNTNLKPENLKAGVTCLGVVGTMQPGIDTSDATATAENIEREKTAYINGKKITGVLWNNVSFNSAISKIVTEENRVSFFTNMPEKYIISKGINNVSISATNNALATAIGLTADKIKAGETILGITGTYTGENDVSL